MLTKNEVEVLQELLESDRMQKQLLQELFDQLLDDEYGITSGAFQTLCELGNAVDIEFDNFERVRETEGRFYLSSEEIPEELDKIEDGKFIIHVGTAVSKSDLWEWIDTQEICTIEHGYYDPELDSIIIHPQWDDQLTTMVLQQLKRDILLKFL